MSLKAGVLALRLEFELQSSDLSFEAWIEPRKGGTYREEEGEVGGEMCESIGHRPLWDAVYQILLLSTLEN